MLAIQNISIMMWILYIDRKQYWKWTINSGANAHDKRTVSEPLKIVTDLTVERIQWHRRGNEQVTRHTQLVGWVDRRLFHSDSATVSQCDNFCCYMYLLCLKLYMTSQRWSGFFFFFFFFWGGHLSPVYLVKYLVLYTDLGRRGYFGVLRRSCVPFHDFDMVQVIVTFLKK